MANPRRRSSSLFPGLLLLFVGLLLLLHNYRGLDVFTVIGRWWPLILIFWGAVKLYERMAASRAGDPGAAKITPGEVFLVLGLLSLLGMVVAVDYGRENIPRHFDGWGNSFSFDLDVAPKPVPADARITIRNGRGNISVRPSDEAQIRISGKKNAKGWNEGEAQKFADRVGVEIVKNGDGYEVRPAEANTGDSRLTLYLDVADPNKASLTFLNSPVLWKPDRAALKSLTRRETSAYGRRTTSRWRTQAARSRSTIAEETWMCGFRFCRKKTSKSIMLRQGLP